MDECKTILFLCTGNYYRSRFAEAYFNAAAARVGLGWRAESRALAIELGVGNVGAMSPAAIAELARLGIPLAEPLPWPEALTEPDLVRAARVIAVNEGEHRPLLATRFPGWEGRATYWVVQDVYDAPPEAALPELVRRVDELVREFSSPADTGADAGEHGTPRGPFTDRGAAR